MYRYFPSQLLTGIASFSGAMTIQLYTRQDCCLCDEMKSTLHRVVGRDAIIEIFDIDEDVKLKALYDTEVPVLFINGRKTFKYSVTEKQLRLKLKR